MTAGRRTRDAPPLALALGSSASQLSPAVAVTGPAELRCRSLGLKLSAAEDTRRYRAWRRVHSGPATGDSSSAAILSQDPGCNARVSRVPGRRPRVQSSGEA